MFRMMLSEYVVLPTLDNSEIQAARQRRLPLGHSHATLISRVSTR